MNLKYLMVQLYYYQLNYKKELKNMKKETKITLLDYVIGAGFALFCYIIYLLIKLCVNII